jgi:AcrR family transcriptional regulator
MPKRARTEADKQRRHDAILRAAITELAACPYEEVTMARVARAAGVAKGTPYLYWRSKEELFLDALASEYADFLDGVVAALGALRDPPPAVVGASIAHEVAARPRFAKLMGLLHGVLERNAPVEAVITFKRKVLLGAADATGAVQRVCPWLDFQGAARLLLRVHGAIVAFRQMADPVPAVRRALEHPDLALLRVEFEPELASLIEDLLVAARVRRG